VLVAKERAEMTLCQGLSNLARDASTLIAFRSQLLGVVIQQNDIAPRLKALFALLDLQFCRAKIL